MLDKSYPDPDAEVEVEAAEEVLDEECCQEHLRPMFVDLRVKAVGLTTRRADRIDDVLVQVRGNAVVLAALVVVEMSCNLFRRASVAASPTFALVETAIDLRVQMQH